MLSEFAAFTGRPKLNPLSWIKLGNCELIVPHILFAVQVPKSELVVKD
jgi:hypothetical protein